MNIGTRGDTFADIFAATRTATDAATLDAHYAVTDGERKEER